MDPRPLVLFHDECMDGIAAAWIAWRRHFERADYQAVRYGQAPPDCTDRLVYILDFSYPPEVLSKLADAASRVVCIDHHATAVARYAEWMPRPDVHLIFDITRSGAALTSEYFNNAAKVWIIDYVEDRDLWKFALPHSKEINALLGASCLGRPYLEAFHALNELRGLSMKEVYRQGQGALLQIECYARMVAQSARRVTFADHSAIPLVNLARPMNSDVLHILAKDALFAVGWYEFNRKVIFSLRAEEGRFDVTTIAERYGGGGHVGAAGFTLGFEAARHFIFEDNAP